MSNVTLLLKAAEQGDPSASQALLPLVYAELRRLAAARLEREKPGQTLCATALVHEAYLRLVGPDGADDRKHWSGRAHFFGAAAEAMRRILIESARRKQSEKRGGDRGRLPLDPDAFTSTPPDQDLLDLDQALQKLEAEHPDKAQL